MQPNEPVKPTSHHTIGPILEAETGVQGCIKKRGSKVCS